MRSAKQPLYFHIFLALLFLFLTNVSYAAETPAPEDIAPDQVDSVLATLSDEQVRSMLISELSKNMEDDSSNSGLVSGATEFLHLLEEEQPGRNTKDFFASLQDTPVDLLNALKKIGDNSVNGFFVVSALLALILASASLIEFFIRRFTADFRKQFQEKAIPDLDGSMRLIAGVMRSIPALIHILVFSTTAVVLFLLLPFHKQAPAQYFFLTIFQIIIFFRCLKQLSQILCAPKLPRLRIIPVNDATAQSVHNGIVFICSYTFSAVFLLAMFKELQLSKSSFNIMAMAFATLLISLIISGIFRSRTAIRKRILQQSERNQTRNWIVEQFAEFWHVPTVLYFVIIWIIMVSDVLNGVERENSTFLMSLLVLPLFVIFDGLGQWVIRSSISNLKISTPLPEDNEDKELEKRHIEDLDRERQIAVIAGRMVRLAILAALLVWVLSLWGYHIPYATEITGAIFESLITMALGLTAWRFASSYIERKILESTPEEEEKKESDNEFGDAAQRGRSYTLLPMLRKFIATTLLVMVTLVILSSFGVDIGPLLAGAGVMGLAVGFGAQKLVSDVFSGFFYLFDDAFRVGEYIQAGSVSGAVESITLRNVMLRHHRGMLQIVPHSDLGPITNFMRGGIIVKFNLDFPYDTNVDKVRKIIKKVGTAMLEDEEFGQDFIDPVKSAGVREITGSVMVIRVKFKAQPGTHFVIRREAYRRITDALAAQGIHYAHRKVIVELPKDESSNLTDKQKEILQAGAAAELAQQEDEKMQKADEQKGGGVGMPGM